MTEIDELFISLKPSVIVAINELERVLRGWGLTKKEILLLIQQRTKPKVPLKYIEATLQAAKNLDKTLIKKGAE